MTKLKLMKKSEILQMFGDTKHSYKSYAELLNNSKSDDIFVVELDFKKIKRFTPEVFDEIMEDRF